MIQRKKLGEIANISAGQGAPQGAENYSEEGTPFVKAGDLFYLVNGERECDIQKVSEEVAKNHRLKLYPKGTVLFAKSGMSCMKGYVYATNAECYVVSHLACIMPFDVDSKYLKYYFEYHKPNQLVKDASYPSISLADIAEMPINVFDDQTEAKIVDNLDAVNSLIAKSKEELGLLDNIVKSRFVEMFGEPIANTHSLPLISLSEVGSWNSGGTPSRSNPAYFEGDIDWYSAGELNTLYLEGSVEKITQDALENSTAKLFPAGSMLVGMYDTAAFKMGILKWSSASNQACACIEPNNSIDIVWLYHVLQIMKPHFLEQRRGIRQKNLNLGMIKSFQIPYASKPEQNRFASFVSEVDKSKFRIQKSLSIGRKLWTMAQIDAIMNMDFSTQRSL